MINQVILVGNLGRDPKVGETPGNKRYAHLSLATSDTWRDRATGEKRARTEWHRVTIWGDGLCSMLAKYAKKGTKVYVQGKLQTRKWTDTKGVERFTTEVVVQGGETTIRLLGEPAGGGNRPPPPDAEPEGYRSGDHQAPF